MVSLENLRKQWNRSEMTPFEVLLGLPRLDFMAAEHRQIHYSLSAFLVRYLVDSPVHSARFHAFLRSVASGGNGDGDDLLSQLDTSWSDLRSGFADWLYTAGPASGGKKKKR